MTRRNGFRTVLLALLSLGGAAVSTQAPAQVIGQTPAQVPAQASPPMLAAPPPLPAPGSASSAPAQAAPARPPAEATEDSTLADLPPARKPAPETRIEQKRSGNRVVEVVVTPAGSTRSYTIVNREGQRPANVQDLSSGLSTPRFFKFDF